jgi:hypothetical protein
MAAITLSLRPRFAWWFRGALVGVLILGRVCPRCISPCIEFIVDNGMKIESA